MGFSPDCLPRFAPHSVGSVSVSTIYRVGTGEKPFRTTRLLAQEQAECGMAVNSV